MLPLLCVASTHPVEATIPEQAARQLDQPQVVLVLLVISHQDPAAFAQPGQCPLHHPPPRLVNPRAVTRLLLLPDPPNMRRVPRALQRLASGRVVIPLVQAQVLWLLLRRLRSLDDDRLDGR